MEEVLTVKIRKYILWVLVVLAPLWSFGQQWETIFNKKDLTGWFLKGGDAKFEVINGEIVGTAVVNTPSSYLCSEKLYEDFILELEVYLEDELNAGVQFRSAENSEGGVYGYQFEIDPGNRKWTGGIYDEGRSGWLYPLSRNELSRDAFQFGKWNKLRIEAYGSQINTYVNGQQCSRLIDDQSHEGFIGLQVQSIGDKEEENGFTVKWRNLEILTSEVGKYLQVDSKVTEVSYLINSLSTWEKRNGFRLLWDGKSAEGWREFNTLEFPKAGWQISDGVLTVLRDETKSKGQHIVTNEVFGDFELEIDFRVTEGANSGIRYFVNEAASSSSCEYQLLDDELHVDATLGINGNRKLAALYDLIRAEPLSRGVKKDPFKGVGNWNKARIVSKDGHVEHWLNNVKMVEYDRYSQMFEALVAYSKYSKRENFGRWEEGHILLHDHHDEVSFRSIKIRELNY